MNKQKPQHPQLPDGCTWIVVISDKGITARFSVKAIEAWGKAARVYLARVALPLALSVGTGLIGAAGAKVWLRQQPNTPTATPTETVTPQP